MEIDWFKNNVAFIFSKGCIFNEDDIANMQDVLNVFIDDHNGTRFLDNIYKILDYENDMIKSIENQMAIGNGNYHILLVTLVLNDADITKAPEIQYMKVGLIQKYMNWKQINDIVTESLAKYGVVSEKPIAKRSSVSNPVVPKEIDTNIHEDIVELFPARVKSTGKQRTNLSFDKNRSRMIKHPSLQTRIREDTIPKDSMIIPISDDQIYLKYDGGKPEPKKKPDFIIFDTDNDNVTDNVESKFNIPVFKQTEIRSAKTRRFNPNTQAFATARTE